MRMIQTFIRFGPSDLKKYRFCFAAEHLISANETPVGTTHICMTGGVQADIDMKFSDLMDELGPSAPEVQKTIRERHGGNPQLY